MDYNTRGLAGTLSGNDAGFIFEKYLYGDSKRSTVEKLPEGWKNYHV